MRAFRLLLIITLLALPSINVWAQNSNELSIAQLKEQIQKLAAIDRDETLPAELRELNRAFLKQRRLQLQSQLQRTVEGLQSYLKELDNSLRPEEKLLVQNKIKQAEQELLILKEETEARVGNGSPAPPQDSAPNANATATVTPPASNIGNLGNGHGNGVSATAVNASAAPVTASTTQPAQPAAQPQAGASLNDIINERIQAKAESRVEQTDNTNQTDVPSASSTSGSLVDQSSASDLIGLATNLAGLSASTNDGQPDPSSVSVTASAYSLLAAIKRVDPLNTEFYNQHRNWRKFSVTLGYDDEDLPNGTKQRAKLFGAKFLFIDRRDPSLHTTDVETIGENLRIATAAFGDLSVRVRAFVFSLDSVRTNIFIPGFKDFLERRRAQFQLRLERERNTLTATNIAEINETVQRIDQMLKNPGDEKLFVGRNFLATSTWSDEEKLYRTQFLNEYLGADYRQKLGDDIANAIDEFIDQQLTDGELVAFKNLNSSARQAVENIRRAPQLSLDFTTKQRRIGIDEYLGTLIFDYGVADRINLTLNGAYSYNDSNLIGGDIRGFKFAGQLRFQLNRENLLGKKPLFFDISTQGSWMNNVDAIYKAQGKLTIPIADGIDFPISVTWANRTSLIDEKEVRGQFGFTLDTARLIRAFLFR